MDLHPDWKEFIEFFNAHHVEFAVVGAYAVGFHSTPHTTADIDFVILPNEENATRMRAALADFGIHLSDEEAAKVLLPHHVIQLGAAPYRIDIYTSVDGVTTQDLLDRAVTGILGGQEVRFPCREDLIAMKKACARPKDLADLHRLERCLR